jgi:hypothetical protein
LSQFPDNIFRRFAMKDGRKGLIMIKDWLFDRMAEVLEGGKWKLRVVKTRKFFRRRDYRESAGLTYFPRRTIYLDRKYATVEVLLHECAHALFSRTMFYASIHRGMSSNSAARYEERKTENLENILASLLTPRQRRRLEKHISRAEKKYRREKQKRPR